MNGKHLTIALAAPVLGMVLITTGCDDMLNMTPPGFSFVHDPYPFYTIVNSKTTQAQLFRVEFNHFGMGFKLFSSNLALPGPHLSIGRRPLGGGTLDPDPDEHFMDPDLWPEPDDEFPLPEPPMDLPDYPDEDPFDGLPEPPPFPDDMLPITDLSNGDITIVNTGGTDNPKGVGRQSSIQGTIRVGTQPAGLARTLDRVYMATANMGDDTISLIQGGTVIATIKLPGGTHPYALAFSPDNARIYVTSWVRTGAVMLTVDVNSRQVIGTITTAGGFPSGVAVTPDGSQVWVTSAFGDAVTVVDALSNTTVTQIGGVSNAWGIAFNIMGTRAFVANADTVAGGVTAIDTATYRVIRRVPTGDGSRTVMVSPTGRHVFVTNRNGNSVSQVDARGLTLIRNIVVGPNPEGLQMVT